MKQLLGVVWLFLPTLLFSQMGATFPQNQRLVRGTIVYQSFNVEDVDDPISEFSFPIQVNWSFTPEINLQILHTPASSQFGEYKLAGMSDTYLKGNYLFLDQKALVGVGLGLPTGLTQLNDKEFYVSQLLATNALRFQLPVFGQGFTANFGVAYAHPVNPKVVFGVGFNYIVRGSYKPVKESIDDYNPGDQIGFNLGTDILISEDKKLFIDGLYHIYLPDKIRGREAFGSGDKVVINIGFLMNMDYITILVDASFRQKGKNELWTGTKLEPEEKSTNGPQAELDGYLRYAVNQQLGALGFLSVRAHGENELRYGDAAIFGIGGGIDFAFTPLIIGDLGIKAYVGRLGGGSAAKSINGFEVLTGCSFNL